MQSPDYHQPDYGQQYHQPPIQSNHSSIVLILALLTGMFAFYAVQNHLISQAFVYLISTFADSFSLKTTSIYTEIALLLLLLLALFGLFCLFKFFLVITIAVLIIAILAAVFIAPNDKQNTVKIKADDKFERVWGG